MQILKLTGVNKGKRVTVTLQPKKEIKKKRIVTHQGVKYIRCNNSKKL